jgi:hypothetical protein
MRVVLLSFLLFGFWIGAESKKPKGYLGKRAMLGVCFRTIPAMGWVSGVSNARYRDGATEGVIINTQYEFNLGYAISRRSIFKLTNSYSRTAFSYEDFDKATMSLKVKTLGFQWECFLGNKLPAPLGAYFQFGAIVATARIQDRFGYFYGENGVTSKKYGFVFTDPNYLITMYGLSIGFGRKRLIFKDRVLLNLPM